MSIDITLCRAVASKYIKEQQKEYKRIARNLAKIRKDTIRQLKKELRIALKDIK